MWCFDVVNIFQTLEQMSRNTKPSQMQYLHIKWLFWRVKIYTRINTKSSERPSCMSEMSKNCRAEIFLHHKCCGICSSHPWDVQLEKQKTKWLIFVQLDEWSLRMYSWLDGIFRASPGGSYCISSYPVAFWKIWPQLFTLRLESHSSSGSKGK